MANKNISTQTQNTVLELTGKFGSQSFLSKLFGSGKKEKEVSFSGKAKVLKSTGTASKIKPLPQNGDMNDMLMKIYSFLQKNSEDDKLYREKQNNFKEENIDEDNRRHQKLLDALEELKKNLLSKEETSTAEKEEDEVNFFTKILGLIGGAQVLGAMVSFFASPLFLGTAATLAVLAYAWKLWKESEPEQVQKTLAGQEPAGITAAGLGAEGQLPLYNQSEEEKKKLASMASPYVRGQVKHEKDYTKLPLPVLEAYRDELVGYGGRAKTSPHFEKLQILDKEIDERKKQSEALNSNTITPLSSTPSVESKEIPPPSEKLNSAVNENNNTKIDAMQPTPSVSTINNTVASVSNSKKLDKLDVPHVRNQEESFQKMILYSTRVV
jgi:F0F1-type ATP synthase assembly protein I